MYALCDTTLYCIVVYTLSKNQRESHMYYVLCRIGVYCHPYCTYSWRSLPASVLASRIIPPRLPGYLCTWYRHIHISLSTKQVLNKCLVRNLLFVQTKSLRESKLGKQVHEKTWSRTKYNLKNQSLKKCTAAQNILD